MRLLGDPFRFCSPPTTIQSSPDGSRVLFKVRNGTCPYSNFPTSASISRQICTKIRKLVDVAAKAQPSAPEIVVHIDDIDASSFLFIINYFSSTKSEISLRTLLSVRKVAQSYAINGIVGAVDKLIITHLDLENFCAIYKLYCDMNNLKMINKCLNRLHGLQGNHKRVINSSTFLRIKPEWLTLLFHSQCLRVRQKDVLEKLRESSWNIHLLQSDCLQHSLQFLGNKRTSKLNSIESVSEHDVTRNHSDGSSFFSIAYNGRKMCLNTSEDNFVDILSAAHTTPHQTPGKWSRKTDAIAIQESVKILESSSYNSTLSISPRDRSGSDDLQSDHTHIACSDTQTTPKPRFTFPSPTLGYSVTSTTSNASDLGNNGRVGDHTSNQAPEELCTLNAGFFSVRYGGGFTMSSNFLDCEFF